jgi:CheY-like chemotaxis protein/energy-coupling factor transporter ATP-binding protein EcfA2
MDWFSSLKDGLRRTLTDGRGSALSLTVAPGDSMADPLPRSHREQIHPASSTDLVSLLSRRIVGQSAATQAIVPYIEMYRSGLAPEGRPAGIFLLLGPTGTGKTKTVEAIADLLHGNEQNILKIDCGEFQMEHAMAKLIGAPPGYMGHGETVPLITQQSLLEITSEESDLSLVLFDELEKAAPSLTKLLLGMLDKGMIRLGDNSIVNFVKSLVFFTSNIGAREMMRAINPEIGFGSSNRPRPELSSRLESIALGAVRRRFSPEFVNRMDAIITYQPLDEQSLERILDHDIKGMQEHVNSRLGDRCFAIEVAPESREFLLRKGSSQEYGARELKRTLHRELIQPLATMVAREEVPPGSRVAVLLSEDGGSLVLRPTAALTQTRIDNASILIVDDNRDLLNLIATLLKQAGWKPLTAQTARHARRLFMERRPQAALLDYMLDDENTDGIQLGSELRATMPETQVIIMTGGGLGPEDVAICEERNFNILYKPFLAVDILNLLRGRKRQSG